MSSWLTTVGIENTNVLNFDEFYAFLNGRDDESYEERYFSEKFDGTLEKFREKIKKEFETAVDEQHYVSDECFFRRELCGGLEEFIKWKGGFEISDVSITGWNPILMILTGDNKRYKEKLAEIKNDG